MNLHETVRDVVQVAVVQVPVQNAVVLDESENKKNKQRQEDIHVYIAMGLILLITALVVFVKISFQNIFLTEEITA